MKTQSIFLVNSTHKTKSWWTFLSVLVLVFVPFLIVWLLCGEFNLLGNDWMIAKNTSMWHGYVTDNNYDYLVAHYSKYRNGDLIQWLQQYLNVDKQGSIDSAFTFFSPIVLAPLFGILVWSIIYPIIFNATKISGLDVLPFSFGIGTFMITLIVSGLIDQWGQNLMSVYWLVRLVIAGFTMLGFFLLCNFFVNKYLAGRDYAVDIFFGYKQLDKENAMQKQQLKENVDIFKKQKDQEESFVEVKEGE